MGNQRNKLSFLNLVVMVLVGVFTFNFVTSRLRDKGETYQLERISIFDDLEGDFRNQAILMASCNIDMHFVGYSFLDNAKKYPKLKSEDALFGRLLVGLEGSEDDYDDYDDYDGIFYVVDESSGAGTGYDVLIVDSNFDQDLTNDPVLKLVDDSPLNGSDLLDGASLFESFDLQMDGHGEQGQLTFWPAINKMSDDELDMAMELGMDMGSMVQVAFVCETAYKGEIALGDKQRDVVAVMAVSALGFNSILFEDNSEIVSVSSDSLYCNADKFWDLESANAGSAVVVRQVNAPLSTIEFVINDKAKLSGLSLDSEDSKSINFFDLDDVDNVSVPRGDYVLMSAGFEIGDYSYSISSDFSDDHPFYDVNLKKGKIHTIDLTKPVEVQIQAPARYTCKGDEDEITIAAEFLLPEQNLALGVVMGDGSIVEPKVEIYDENDKQIIEASLSYG